MTTQEIKAWRESYTQQIDEDRQRGREAINEYFESLCRLSEVLAKDREATRINTPFGTFVFHKDIKPLT